MPVCCARFAKIDAAIFGLALLLCGMPVSRPDAQAVAPGGNEPIQIQADSGIEWQQDAHLYIARGNAVAVRGPGEVHADTLIAHYRETKGGEAKGSEAKGGKPAGDATGNTEIYRVEAEGHVTLKRGSQTVVGDRAVEDVDRAITVVTGKGLKLTTPSDVVTARDSLEWYDEKQIAVARGDAVAIRNGKTIKADILTAYMVKSQPPQDKAGAPGTKAGAPGSKPGARPDPAPTKAAPTKPAVAKSAPTKSAPTKTTVAIPGGAPAASPVASAGGKTEGAAAADSKISRVDAQGHVVIKNAADTGRGDFGVYNAETGIATLIGNVVIERGKDVIRGQHGVMDLNKNISRMMPGDTPGMAPQRVQGLFVRRDPDAKGPASAAAPATPGGNPASAGNKRP